MCPPTLAARVRLLGSTKALCTQAACRLHVALRALRDIATAKHRVSDAVTTRCGPRPAPPAAHSAANPAMAVASASFESLFDSIATTM